MRAVRFLAWNTAFVIVVMGVMRCWYGDAPSWAAHPWVSWWTVRGFAGWVLLDVACRIRNIIEGAMSAST